MLTLNIVTPDRRVIGPIKVSSITLPAAQGEITVLPGHARLLSVVLTGVISFDMENGTKNGGAISTGFVEVNDDKVTLLAETLELVNEIDLSRAEKAKKEAEDRLKMGDVLTEPESEKWQRKHDRAMARISARFLLPPHGEHRDH